MSYSFPHRYPFRHLPTYVGTVVIIHCHDLQCLVPGEPLHGPDVANGEVQGFCDGRVTQPVRPDLNPRGFPELLHDVVRPF